MSITGHWVVIDDDGTGTAFHVGQVIDYLPPETILVRIRPTAGPVFAKLFNLQADIYWFADEATLDAWLAWLDEPPKAMVLSFSRGPK